MAKTITLKYDGAEYTLEFTRKSIETMEKQGFVIGDMGDRPVTMLPMLFSGAFLAHHRSVRKDIIDKIFDGLTNRDELFQKLAEMYAEPIEALMDDPEVKEGNATWGANW